MTNTSTDDRSPWSVFLIFLRLGLTSFGGPIAHLGYFRDEFVTRRRWLSERSYADLVALCQFLPGPASSQVGIALGLSRAGYSGALAAWTGFTLPSAVALILFALGISNYGDSVSPGALHGLKVVAVAVVAQAVWGMARNLCTDGLRVTIMAIAACAVLLVPSAWGQVGVIAAAGIIGRLLFKPAHTVEHDPLPITVSHRAGALWLSLFFALLIGLPILAKLLPSPTMVVVDAFYRVGSLVFGGGHVVLPLLQAEVVSSGWVSNESSPLQSSLLLSERMAYKLHRQGQILETVGADVAVCYEYPSPIIPKERWRYQMVNMYPEPGNCHPFGASTQLWGTTHNSPSSKKNFGYLFWRKRNCVFL